MANDFLGGLGGLMKGLSGFMANDDPATKMVAAAAEVSNLEKQEAELYVQIGKQATELYGLDQFGDTANKLRLVQSNLSAARSNLAAIKSQQDAEEMAKRAAEDERTCTSCGHRNPEGTKFCQDCGAKLGAPGKKHCTSCGAQLAPDVRFCGECGARQEEE